jgi:hypothetical protein
MASAIVIGLGTLGAGFAGLTALRMMRGAKGVEKFVRGGFKTKMDRSEAIQILGLRCVAADHPLRHSLVADIGSSEPPTLRCL